MELVTAGDADAFEVVLTRHADAAYSLAYRMCGKRSLAEDITQEAFLSLWRGGGRYDRARGSVRAWTLGIVHNRAADALRCSTCFGAESNQIRWVRTNSSICADGLAPNH